MWSRWILTLQSLITRGGPAPFQPLPAQVDLGLPLQSPEEPCPLPSPYIPGLAIGESVYWEALNKDGSGVEIRSQPSTNPVLLDNVCNITLISFRKLYLKCLPNDWSPSIDYCCILGWFTTTRNKQVLPMCVHHIFPGWFGTLIIKVSVRKKP